MKRCMYIGTMLLIVMGLFGVTLWAQQQAKAPAKPKMKLTVAGLSVAKPDPDDEFSGSMAFGLNRGTHVYLKASVTGPSVVDIKEDKCSLTAYTDDKGTALIEPGAKASGYKGWLEFVRVAEDGKSVSFQINSEKLPAAGSTKLKIQAKLAIVCAASQEQAETQVALKVDEQLKLGPVATKIKEIGKPEWGDAELSVTFAGKQSFDTIKELKFIGPDGEEIEASRNSSMSGMGNYEYQYSLAKKVDQATINVTYYTDLKTYRVPVNVNVGVGL